MGNGSRASSGDSSSSELGVHAADDVRSRKLKELDVEVSNRSAP